MLKLGVRLTFGSRSQDVVLYISDVEDAARSLPSLTVQTLLPHVIFLHKVTFLLRVSYSPKIFVLFWGPLRMGLGPVHARKAPPVSFASISEIEL